VALIGLRLRDLRIKKDLTLKEVAEATGFAVSYLSQLERDMVSISVDNLERLANYYQVHLVYFFRGSESNPVSVTRAAEIEEVFSKPFEGPAAVTLLSNRPEARMEPMLVRIGPGFEEPHFRAHDAETILYIIKGQARLISENGEETILYAGDFISYENIPKRRLANLSEEEPLYVIAITDPPTNILEGADRNLPQINTDE
jgi:transcriptional regulator with XRE-family HTH domain